MSALRRYEILLPLRFNDGEPVPDELIGQSLLELRRQFGAITQETQVVRGTWEHEGHLYRDDLSRVFVDVEDNVETRRFFSQWKEQLKARFHQLEMTSPSIPWNVSEHGLFHSRRNPVPLPG